MREDRALVFLGNAGRQLSKANTVMAKKDVADTARAVEVWARRARKGPETVGKAIRYQLEAWAGMGEILRGMAERGEREARGRGPVKYQNGTRLKDLGVTKKESSRAQLLASLPAAARRECFEEGQNRLAVTAALKFAKGTMEKQLKIVEVEALQQRYPEGRVENLETCGEKFRCILADPPWSYTDQGCSGGLDSEYKTMGLDDICARPVAAISEDDAHLWLWATWPMLRDGAPQRVLDAWGFRWVGEIVWVKNGLGVGRWLRPSTEILILGVKGKLKLLRYNQRGHLNADREGHSVKPEVFYEAIETLTPGPRIELFARRPRSGWKRWGDQA